MYTCIYIYVDVDMYVSIYRYASGDLNIPSKLDFAKRGNGAGFEGWGILVLDCRRGVGSREATCQFRMCW